MSDQEKDQGLAVGLDIGTSRIVVARRQDEETEIRSQLNAFVNVPYTKMTENALRKQGIPFEHRDSELVVYGDESVRFADLLGIESRRPMTAGIVNPSEPAGAQVIQNLVDLLLDDAAGKDSLVYFSVPALPLGEREDRTYHNATIRDILKKKGYRVESIDEGLAVVYSELEDSNYTGIGISCGGGLCNICLAYLSVPILSFSIPKAGDFIDSSAAGVTGDRAIRIRLEKEGSFQFNGDYSNKLQQAIGVYYDDMIQAIVTAMKDAFNAPNNLPKLDRPVPLVLSGGTAMPKGFAQRFERALRATALPVPVAEIRLAANPLQSTAKGALVAALTEF